MKKLMNNSNYENWKSLFDAKLSEAKKEISDYLDETGFGLELKLVDDYLFNGHKSKWLAAYLKRGYDIVADKTIRVAINYKRLYEEMSKRNIEDDDFNIEAQAYITLSHEVGHAIVDYIRNCPKFKIPRFASLREIVTTWSKPKEEEVVEEFGLSFFPQGTGVYDSELGGIVEKFSSLLRK